MAVRLACAQDYAGLDHRVVGMEENIAAVFPGSSPLSFQGHAFPGQNHTVAGKVLHSHAGAHPVTIAFRKGQIFSPVTGETDHIGICGRIYADIPACRHRGVLSQGNDTLVMEPGQIHRSRQVQIGTAVLRIHRVTAHIIVGIRSRADSVG